MAKKNTPTPPATPETGLVVSHRMVELTPVDHYEKDGFYYTGEEAAAAAGPELTKVYDIKRAKIKDGKLIAEYTEIHQGDGQEPRRFEMVRSGGPLVHPDLKAQFLRLVPYLVHITHQSRTVPVDIAENGGELPIEYLNFEVSGISLSDNGVTLVGTRTVWDTRKLNLVSPFIDYGNEKREPWYPYVSEVSEIVLAILGEVCLAIDGKSWQPQLGLFAEKAA